MTKPSGAAGEEATERLIDEAQDALDRGDGEGAVNLCSEVLDQTPEHPGAWFVLGEAWRDLREPAEAEAAFRSVTRLVPDHAPGWSGLAAALFDLLRFEDARVAALRALRVDPHDSEAYYVRAMLRERRSDWEGAQRDFLRAARLDPIGWPLPAMLSDAMISAVIDEARRALHPTIRSYLDQVPFLIEEVPPEELCRQFDPPAPPGEMLGVFSGPSLVERTGEDPWSQLPATIVLFRRNVQRIAHDREQLIDELRITVLHEVGHFLGLDEDDLEARGLD